MRIAMLELVRYIDANHKGMVRKGVVRQLKAQQQAQRESVTGLGTALGTVDLNLNMVTNRLALVSEGLHQKRIDVSCMRARV